MEKKVKKRPWSGREKKKIVAEKCNKKKIRGVFPHLRSPFYQKKKKKKMHSA